MLQIITSKKIEIEHGKYSGGKSSERIRNKRLRGSTTLSAVTAALRDEESETEPEEPMEEDVCIKCRFITNLHISSCTSYLAIMQTILTQAQTCH